MSKLLIPLTVIAVGTAMNAVRQTSAVQYDLVNNSTQTVPGLGGNNAIFDKSSLKTSGTGVIDPFLRLQSNGNSSFEKAFNTSAAGNPPDGLDAKNGIFTHDLLLSSLQTVTHLGSGSYYQFTLDLGEPGNKPAGTATTEQLLLQTFALYTGNNDAPTPAEIAGNPNNLGTKRYDLAGNSIMFFDENSGNGQADVSIFVPTSVFAGVTDTYLYLYTELGIAHTGGPQIGDAEGSFEEFSALTGATATPDGGATMVLLGGGISALALLRRKLS